MKSVSLTCEEQKRTVVKETTTQSCKNQTNRPEEGNNTIIAFASVQVNDKEMHL